MAEQHIREKVTSNHLKTHQWGVVLDIDETVLDNSQWNHEQALHNESGSWDNFASKGISVPTPGAKKFLHDIHLMGGYINLVSNRSNTLRSATIKNLDAQGMYFDQVLLDTTNTGTSFVNKNPRFEAIITGKSPSILPPQKIIACFGDNIQDFPAHLQKQMINENSNGKAYNSFGVTDFVLPNPMYGSWEKNKFN